MACKKCGKCCGYVNFRFMLNDENRDYVKWWKLHHLQVEQVGSNEDMMNIKVDSPCYWYDPLNSACLHYEDRPKVCRDFMCDEAKKNR